jgi:hypothetical protein
MPTLLGACPRAQYPPHRRRHCCSDPGIDEPSAAQMPQCRLHGRFREPGLRRNALKTHGYGIPPALRRLPQEKQVDDERGRPAVVPDKFRHQDIDYIRINGETLHSSKYYTD